MSVLPNADWRLPISSTSGIVRQMAIGHWKLAMTNVWQFDPAYTTVEFVIRNLWFNVNGRFSVLEGAIVLDEDDVRGSSVSASIRAHSVATGNKRRDAHLMSAEFFDVENFPDIEFKSSRVERGTDRDSLDLNGNLLFKGRNIPVALAVNEIDRSRSPGGEEFVYYSATAEVDRFDLGINYGRGLIGRRLKVTINVQASALLQNKQIG
jgi:polyisoprenoid-binding protein YceI